MTGNPYTTDWRTAVRSGVRRSAAALVPRFLEAVPGTGLVIDVGCGEGWFLDEFERHGVSGVGFEGEWSTSADRPHIEPLDLAAPPYPRVETRAGLVLCLEVAEHLPPEVGPAFVEWLCTLAPVVIFSAAVPGQGGEGHRNEQWQSYWAALFGTQGYVPSVHLRNLIWDDDQIEFWYRQNLVVYSALDPNLVAEFAGAVAEAESVSPDLDVVHPAMVEWHGRVKPEWECVYTA